MKALDEVIDLYSWSLTRGSEGQKIETYTPAGKVFARVSPSTFGAVVDDNAESKESCSVEMYKRRDVTTRWRVKWRGRMYDITSIDMGERLSPMMTIQMSEV